MKKFISTVLMFISTLGFSQGLINRGAFITISSGAIVRINGTSGNFLNSSGGVIDLDGTIALGGNFTNNSTVNVFTNHCCPGKVLK